jgi:hypothetical protein
MSPESHQKGPDLLGSHPNDFPTMPNRLRYFLMALAALAVMAHGIHLAFVVSQGDSPRPAYFMYDSGSYIGDAQALLKGIPLSPAFQDRPMLAILIAISTKLGMPLWTALAVPVVLQGFLVYAMGFIGHFCSSRTSAASIATILAAIYPNFYYTIPLLGTDALGAQFMVLAIGAGLMWRKTLRWKWGAISGTLWLCAQISRPTFAPIVLLMPLLLWPLLWQRPLRRQLAIFALLLVAYPLALSTKNFGLYSIFSPNLTKPEMLSRCVVPKINTMKRHAEQPGPISEYWVDERDRKAVSDPDWISLGLYKTGKRDRNDFAATYKRLIHRMEEYIRLNPGWFSKAAHVTYFSLFLTHPPAYSPLSLRSPPPLWNQWGLRIDKLFLLFVPLGFCILLRRFPSLGLLWGALFTMMLAPLVVFMWLFPSTRLPVDALAIPLAALALSELRVWGLLAGWTLVGWLPLKLGISPPIWTGTSYILCCAACYLGGGKDFQRPWALAFDSIASRKRKTP